MHIRLATIADLPAIYQIYLQGIDEHFTADTHPYTLAQMNEWFLQHSPQSHPVIVYQSGGDIVAWLSFSKYRNGRMAVQHTAEVSYYIDRAHRQQGIGTELLLFAKLNANKYRFKSLLAIVLDTNVGSIRLLQKSGFSQWGYMPKVALFGDTWCGHLYFGLNL